MYVDSVKYKKAGHFGDQNDIDILRADSKMSSRTLGNVLAICGVLLAATIPFIIYIGPTNLPFGIQIATTIIYTVAMLWLIFFPARGDNTEYSLWDERVQEKLPRLLGTHAVFLTWVLAMQVTASVARPHLPAIWFKAYSSRHDTLFEDVGILFYVVTGMAQRLISRGILSRSVEAQKKKSELAANANSAQDDRM